MWARFLAALPCVWAVILDAERTRNSEKIRNTEKMRSKFPDPFAPTGFMAGNPWDPVITGPGKNPWVVRPPYHFLDDQMPIAPLDAVDKLDQGDFHNMVGALQPGQRSAWPQRQLASLNPDVIGVAWELFPQEKTATPMKVAPIGDYLRSKGDQMRPYGWYMTSPTVNYPVSAPESAIPYDQRFAPEDDVDDRYRRWFDQSIRLDAKRLFTKARSADFKRADTTKDNAIQWSEFKTLLVDELKNTEAAANALWAKFKKTGQQALAIEEFLKAAATGFYTPSNITEQDFLMKMYNDVPVGYWADLSECDEGDQVKEVRLKVSPYVDTREDPTADNAGITSIEMKCGKGKILSNAEEPSGTWSGWAKCPGQSFINGFSTRVDRYGHAKDNFGLTNVAFQCENEARTQITELLISSQKPELGPTDRPMVHVKKEMPPVGLWAPVQVCPGNTFIRGFKSRVRPAAAEIDNMGITSMHVKCSPVTYKKEDK